MKNNEIFYTIEKYVIMVGWKSPERDWVKLNMDGAYFIGRTLGCEGIIRGMHGECMGDFSKFIGNCSARRVELWGIYEGLSLANDLGFSRVELNVNSIITIEMLKSRQATNMDRYSLVKQILHLMKMFEEVKVAHTYREANLCANALAKFGVESGEDMVLEKEISYFMM